MFICCIDTETTGIPKKNGGFDEYPDYSETSSYDSSRVIEIGYIIINKYGRILKKVSHLIKPINIMIHNTHIHGITQEEALKNGIKMYDALKELEADLNKCDNLVGHNILFDYNILLSEAYRLNIMNLIHHMKSMKKSCTMKLGRKILKLNKYPKLSELYKTIYNSDVVQNHRALSDVMICFDCYKILIDMNGKKNAILELTNNDEKNMNICL
jgi:DNA polymerase-3 subunit alpha